jgi:hypothetical protein
MGSPSETVTRTIYYDAEHPSHLLLPVIPKSYRAATADTLSSSAPPAIITSCKPKRIASMA